MKITELIDFHFFIQEAKLKYTLTKFCQTSVKVVKDTAKTSVAFGVGTVIQIGENNLIKPVLDKLFG
ncbi:hypothetical protein, partial [Enterococcus faecalis]|uniref:hypothetical protein n=1 Tax=Enterococcus faecalis TaxID=1351 RepID=UPI001C8D6368